MRKRYLLHGVAIFALIDVAAAQSVDLKGVVHDRFSSLPLAQARVSLARLGHHALTDSAGRFHILQVPSQARAEPGRAKPGVLPGRRLAWHAPQAGTVTVQMLDPAGAIRWQARYDLAEAGDWELGMGPLPAGLYVAVLAGPGFRQAAKVVLLGDAEESSGARQPTRRAAAVALAKRAAALDTLRVTRDGYQAFSLPVASLEQAGLVLPLSDTTVSQASLARLELSAGQLEPELMADHRTYSAAVREGVQSLTVTPGTGDGKPSIRVNGALVPPGSPSANIPLSLGNNAIILVVTSQDSSATAEYTVNVHRAYDDSAALAGLGSQAGTLVPAFHPGVFDYTLPVSATANRLTLVPRAFQPLCSLSINGLPLRSDFPIPDFALNPDTTTLTVAVVSPDRSREVRYRVLVRRASAADNDASLRSLVVSPAPSGVKPFHRDTLEYVLYVDPWDSVYAITATTSHHSATLAMRGTPQASGVARQAVVSFGWWNMYIDVTSADRTRTRRYNASFFRRTLLAQPTLAGPNVARVGVPAVFSTGSLTGLACASEFDRRYRLATGNGDTVTTTRRPDSIPYAWSAPGNYALRVMGYCHNHDRPELIDAKSPWSNPKYVTVEAGDATARVRRLTGVRTAPETWSPDTAYIIEGHTRFDSTAALTILPGTWVTFSNSNLYLTANAITAVGTVQDSIHFVGGNVRVQWRGPRAYHDDGGYRAGPRFEFASFKDTRLHVLGNDTATGGYGCYLKDSYVRTLTGDTSKIAVGTYVERCRIDAVDSLRLFESRIVNSHLGTVRIITNPGRPVEIRRCDIRTLHIPGHDFRQENITGNTIRRFSAYHATLSHPGKLAGNNLLPALAVSFAIGASPVDLRGNYWGEAATAEMVSKGPDQNIAVINDAFDDPARGKADYSGWLTAPVPGAAPDW